MNVRTGDGLTNGADNVIKLVYLRLISKQSGITWVQFDKADIGKKERHENRHLLVEGIGPRWTLNKPERKI